MPVWSNLNEAFGGVSRGQAGMGLKSCPDPMHTCCICGYKMRPGDAREQHMPAAGFQIMCVKCRDVLYPKPGEIGKRLWMLRRFKPASRSVERAVLWLIN